jgi:hypothetical protein
MDTNQGDVRAAIGQAGIKISVFEGTMQHAILGMEGLNKSVARPNEENLTGALVGCILSSFPWCVTAYGPYDVPGATCEWAQYNKNGLGPHSESRKGADFALLIKMPSSKVRVALFQAKSDKSEKIRAGHIKLHHAVSPLRPDGPERTQMGMLFAAGIDILNRSGMNYAGVQHTGFVHYLAQIEDGVRCVQLSQLGDELRHELDGIGGDNLYEVPLDAVTFLGVLLDVLSPVPKYWQDISIDIANEVLPQLLDLMEVFVGEDGRGGTIAPARAEKITLAQEVAPTAPNPTDTPSSTTERQSPISRRSYGG